eukprot:35864-Karenia_brevis.AAC.1
MFYERQETAGYESDTSESPGDLEFWPVIESDIPKQKLRASRASSSHTKSSSSKSTFKREANAGGYEAASGGAPSGKSLRFVNLPVTDFKKPWKYGVLDSGCNSACHGEVWRLDYDALSRATKIPKWIPHGMYTYWSGIRQYPICLVNKDGVPLVVELNSNEFKAPQK